MAERTMYSTLRHSNRVRNVRPGYADDYDEQVGQSSLDDILDMKDFLDLIVLNNKQEKIDGRFDDWILILEVTMSCGETV